jgi:pimeloyl-ACP methyl ester carboxylesterase
MAPRIRRAVLTAAAVLVFLVLAGATYQGLATALERRQFPHPGRMVDVGDHQLHIYCLGEGTPTVVLEAPATGMSAAWGWVQPAVAAVTRVCSYDRAGLGWSEAGDRRFDPALVPDELHALLERSGEPGPYVLAGHGLGAAFATSYATRYPIDLAALVLIDPPLDAAPESSRADPTRLVKASPWLARAGVLRATRMLSRSAAGLPALPAGELRAFLNRPDHLTRAGTELSRWNDALALAAAAALPDDLSVTRMDAAGQGRTALLTDPGEAKPVASAILGAVSRARREPSISSPSREP